MPEDDIAVLYVDDDAEVASSVAAVLDKQDDRFVIDIQTDPHEALDAIEASSVDCVVADYDIEEMTGLELLTAVREFDPEIPYILYTGKGSEAVASDAISAGVTDYLQRGAGSEQYELLANRIINAVEKRRAEAAVAEKRDRLRGLLEAFPDLAFYIDEDGTYVDVISGTESPLLYDDADVLIGSRFDEILPPDIASQFNSTVSDALASGSVQTIEYDLEVASGTRWFEARVVPLETRQDGKRLVVWLARDITEHKEREQTLAELHDAAQRIVATDDEETVYETLMETAKRVLDFDGVVIDVEAGGYLIQEAWSSEIEEGGYYERTSLAEDDTFAVRAYNQQETLVVDDIRETDLGSAGSEYRSAVTVPIGTFGTFQAVSTDVGAFDEIDREFAEILANHTRVKLAQLADKQELRERTRELEHTNEQLDQFASVIGHDLRNPLNTLELSLEAARRSGDEEHFERCQRSIDRMSKLLEDLLTLAREGEELDEMIPVEIGTAATNAWETIETANGTLDVETDLTIEADPTRLTQVLENLLHNAVEHGRDDQEPITVTVDSTDQGFYVADNGNGLPTDDVFETGYSTAEAGTGFGLAIVEKIVEAHGWEVTADESAAGGARFDITGVDTV